VSIEQQSAATGPNCEKKRSAQNQHLNNKTNM
jgi:hypothetical protein